MQKLKSINDFHFQSIEENKMREDRLSWDDHHMLLAMLTAQRSLDPNTQVGACIVDQKNRILGLGYNGFPRGVGPHSLPWERKGEPLNTKYPYVVHAEKNAIYNAKRDVTGATLYVTMFPCNECAKDIIQAGIHKIIYLTNPYEDQWQTKASKKLLEAVDLIAIQHKWEKKEALLCLKNLSDQME